MLWPRLTVKGLQVDTRAAGTTDLRHLVCLHRLYIGADIRRPARSYDGTHHHDDEFLVPASLLLFECSGRVGSVTCASLQACGGLHTLRSEGCLPLLALTSPPVWPHLREFCWGALDQSQELCALRIAVVHPSLRAPEAVGMSLKCYATTAHLGHAEYAGLGFDRLMLRGSLQTDVWSGRRVK